MTIEEAQEYGRKAYRLWQRDVAVAAQWERMFSEKLAVEPDDTIVVLWDAFFDGYHDAQALDVTGVR